MTKINETNRNGKISTKNKRNEPKRKNFNKNKRNEPKRKIFKKTKRNETKRNETKRNETNRNEPNRNETKRNETKRNETNQTEPNRTEPNRKMFNNLSGFHEYAGISRNFLMFCCLVLRLMIASTGTGSEVFPSFGPVSS